MTENISFGHILTVSSFKATKPLQIPQTAESPGHVPTRPAAGTAQLQGHIENEDRCETGSCPPRTLWNSGEKFGAGFRVLLLPPPQTDLGDVWIWEAASTWPRTDGFSPCAPTNTLTPPPAKQDLQPSRAATTLNATTEE